jgi:hypothetical protein
MERDRRAAQQRTFDRLARKSTTVMYEGYDKEEPLPVYDKFIPDLNLRL